MLGRGTLERLAEECRDKSVYIGVRESYMWSLPLGTFLSGDTESANMGVLFGNGCTNYNNVNALLTGYNRNDCFVFEREDSLALPVGTKLELKAGAHFANKSVKLLRYDEVANKLVDTEVQRVCDELGYVTFTVDRDKTYVIVIAEE